jgi:hypothetical protein
MNRSIVLSLCDYTGNMVEPWRQNGYECWIVDILHPKGISEDASKPNLVKVGADIRDWLPPRSDYKIAFAAPPCTDLAVSGARWFSEKGLRSLIKSLQLVETCRLILEWTDAPFMIENPVSTLSTYWRKPDFMFDPCDYGGYMNPPSDHYRKKTCLWTGHGFKMPLKRPVNPSKISWVHLLPPSANRGDLRSVTPLGFAWAVYEANKK